MPADGGIRRANYRPRGPGSPRHRRQGRHYAAAGRVSATRRWPHSGHLMWRRVLDLYCIDPGGQYNTWSRTRCRRLRGRIVGGEAAFGVSPPHAASGWRLGRTAASAAVLPPGARPHNAAAVTAAVERLCRLAGRHKSFHHLGPTVRPHTSGLTSGSKWWKDRLNQRLSRLSTSFLSPPDGGIIS